MFLNFCEILGLLFAGIVITYTGFTFGIFKEEMSKNQEDKKQEQSDPEQESDNNE